MKEIELISREQREALAGRIEVLDKVKEPLLLPVVGMASTPMIADYFEVAHDTVQKCYQRHAAEIDPDGVEVWTPKTMKAAGVPLIKRNRQYWVEVDGVETVFPNRGAKLFSPRAVLRMSMLLQDSTVAQAIRQQLLLDAEGITPITTENAHADGSVDAKDIQILDGIQCYERDGVVYLNLEAVARGLGFTESKCGVDYVMWRRVDDYLDSFGTSAERPDFIPENVFYRLAMKVKNEVAEQFQAKVADEIIPSIRRHGMYATAATVEKMLADPDTMIQVLTALRDERAKNQQLVESNKALETSNAMLAKQELTWDGRLVINRLIRLYSAMVFGGSFQLGWADYYRELKYRKSISLKQRAGKGSLLDRLKKEELSDAIAVAAALCHEHGIDPAAAVNDVNAAEYLVGAAG